MCGAFKVSEGPALTNLAKALGVHSLEGRGLRLPTQPIQIVATINDQRAVLNATWWLLLDANGRPNQKYATFNSRSDKLQTSSLTKHLYRHSRCVIPVTSFVEGQGCRYHQLARPEAGIAFGGLLRTIEVNGEPVHPHRSSPAQVIPGWPMFTENHYRCCCRQRMPVRSTSGSTRK